MADMRTLFTRWVYPDGIPADISPEDARALAWGQTMAWVCAKPWAYGPRWGKLGTTEGMEYLGN